MDNLFKVVNLEKTFSNQGIETKVLKNINFSIKKGEFVSIMGPSGSGKSTLLHILGFLSDHTSGDYYFNNKQYKDYDEDEIAQIRNKEMGFVFQAFNLLPKQTVYENVCLPLLYSNLPEKKWRERVESVVELVGLSHRLDYETYKLSGGEKQRTAIARALVGNPEVIFADEPTGNLDSKSGKVVIETLQKLHKEMGHTVILITHETSTAEHAERMIVIKDGLIESDKPISQRRTAKESFEK